jgi:ATP-dependent DNA ligase
MPVWIEEKLDGWRMMLWKGNAYGRNLDVVGQRKNWWNNLPDHIKSLAKDFPIDGELIWPGHEATDVPTAMKAVNPELRFIGFRLANIELPPHEHTLRIQPLGITVPKLLALSYLDNRTVKDMDLKRMAIANSWEGFILKEKYTVPTWWKFKVEDSYDLVIMDITWPTAGKYKTKGWIKSLKCGSHVKGELVEIANVSGMKEDVRSKISEKDIGRVIEVKANLFASKGKLKHPRFIRWRDDKNAKDCEINRE